MNTDKQIVETMFNTNLKKNLMELSLSMLGPGLIVRRMKCP